MEQGTYEVMQRLADAQSRARFVEKAPQGKHGEYIAHDVINQLALAMVGPHSFEVVELIRGYIPAWVDKDGKERMPQRIDGVTGVLARLTVDLPGHGPVVIVEVGSEDNPQMGSDAENTKKAASDAYKRCWMRLGLGLELWAGKAWSLPKMLTHYHTQVEGQETLL